MIKENAIKSAEPHELKKYILTADDIVLESKDLVYDYFLKCYGYWKDLTFYAVIIKQESDLLSDLEWRTQE